MGRLKISFAVGQKRKASALLNNPTAPAANSESEKPFHSPLIAAPESHDTADAEDHQREIPLPRRKNEPVVTASTESVSRKSQFGATPKAVHIPRRFESSPIVRESRTMAEPPAKRAKRTDSSAMWDRNERPSRPPADREMKDSATGRDRRGDRDRDRERGYGRDDRRHRSRSRDRVEKRRERSRSREHDGGRYRNGDKGRESREARDGRDRRDRERSTSRERHRPRRGRSYGQSAAQYISNAN